MARIDIGQSHYAHLRRGTSKSLLSGLKLKTRCFNLDCSIIIVIFTLLSMRYGEINQFAFSLI